MSRTFVDFPPLDFITTLENMSTEDTQAYKNPEFPEFAIETIRLRSFADWPKMMRQTPEDLSDAGFFYTQISDRVICFSCGGGLCKWDKSDDPWEQHAIWYSTCNYLQLMKGQKYIAAIEKKFGRIQKNKDNEDATPSTSSAQKKDKNASNNSNKDGSSSSWSTNKNKNKNKNPSKKSNDTRLCNICCVNEYNTVFLPCGHVVACVKCAVAQTTCPICREPLKSMNRIYLP